MWPEHGKAGGGEEGLKGLKLPFSSKSASVHAHLQVPTQVLTLVTSSHRVGRAVAVSSSAPSAALSDAGKRCWCALRRSLTFRTLSTMLQKAISSFLKTFSSLGVFGLVAGEGWGFFKF